MAKYCLYCGTQEKIVIDMTMSLAEGESPVAISLCEQHQNKTQLPSLKKAYLKKKQAIEKLKQQAKQYGFDVMDTAPAGQTIKISMPAKAAGPTIMHVQKSGEQTSQSQPAPQAAPVSQHSDAQSTGPAVSTQGRPLLANVPEDAEAPRFAAHEIDKKRAPKVLSTTEQIYERGDGLPIKLPKRIVSEAGETNIRVVQTGGDAAMQARLKNLKNQLDRDENAHSFNKDGYALRTCTLCQGKGKTAINGQTCAKCNGAGEISKL